MALSEGLKSFADFFMKSFNGDVRDDDGVFTGFDEGNGIDDIYGTEVEDNLALQPEYKPSIRQSKPFEREKSKVTNLHYQTGEVTLIEPRSFSESAQIVKKLLENKTVVLNLDLLDKEQSQRTIDFVCGASHALNGKAKKISDMVFIFTPSNVSFSDESSSTQSKFSESLWNKPL